MKTEIPKVCQDLANGVPRYSWKTETFISTYINIPIFFILYFGYKFVRRSKIIPLNEIPIRHFLELAQDEEEEADPEYKGRWRWLMLLWS